MESFRRTHAQLAAREPEKPDGEILEPHLDYLYTPEKSGQTLTDANGHIVVVPIGNVEMPGGSQN